MPFDRARVVLVGLGATTASALAGLSGAFEVVTLVRAGSDATVQLAEQLGVPVCSDMALETVRSIVDRLCPDAVVVSSYDRILPTDMLQTIPYINVHYAPLPRYRGRGTVNWAIINGESHAYISIHCLQPELDAGGILHQDRVPIGPTDTVTDLYNQLNKLQRGAIAGAVARRLAGDPGEPQDPAEATYTCSRVPGDGEIVWSRSTQETDRLVRALTPPFPGAYTFLGTRRLWIRKATIRADSPRYEGRIPGRPVGRAPRGWVDVLTGDGVLRVHEVQLDGEATRPAAEVIRSVKQTLGLRAEDLLARILQLESDQHYGQGRVRDDSQS